MADKKGEQSLPEVDVLMKGMLSQPGVEGFMVFNDEGIPVKWTNNGFVKPGSILGPNPIPPQIIHHAALIGDLAAKARVTMRRLLGAEDGDLQLLRLHTQSNEIIISPTEETTLVVVQKAHQGPQLTIVEVADWEQARMAADAAAKKKT